MAACLACGSELEGEFAFCPHCGAPTTPRTAGALHERRVVSVLFCDMVGSTAAAEHADPEDVRARMQALHGLMRHQIELFGGTVEKFAGDAVMAVFGAPVTHEDDAERAVRAGLGIVQALSERDGPGPEDPTHVRVGVATGEVLVDLAARPEAGEAYATGDVVNTAARIQAAARVDAVMVGEATYRATERVFQYAPADPVRAKGKAEPVRVWVAGEARARLGVDVIRSLTTPLVGRRADLGLLQGSYDKAVAERSLQLVTVVGEPGVGKSRLVAELGTRVERGGEPVTWRQGRCLPYGEGVTFWALGEIVKAHLGIFDSDPAGVAADKLDAGLGAMEDRAWVRSRLLPLLGLDADENASREEAFTAWRRFLESVAESQVTVLVFEDLHWADEALLAFLEHLADWVHGVPLLVVATARPELFDSHPSWGASLRHATTISLAPLSDADTAELVSSLLLSVVLPASTSQAVLERAEGNPLFAEEFVRMLSDRGLVGADGDLHPSADVTVPDGIQALLAARLDTLTADQKALLQDASVIGKVFWAGPLVAMGGRDPAQVRRSLHELTRKELVRPARASSMAGEQELGFWHVLIRDVAYGQIPRAERAAKHAAFASWLAGRTGDRVEDVAEVLAHHTGTAMDLAVAAGDHEMAARLRPETRRYTVLAADKALGMDTTSAQRLCDRALAMTDVDDPDYPALLLRSARALEDSGRFGDAAALLRRATTLCRERGDVDGEARALGFLSEVAYQLGEVGDTSYEEAALALLRTLPPGGHLVEALLRYSDGLFVMAEYQRSLEVMREAVDVFAEVQDGGPSGWPLEQWLRSAPAQPLLQLGDATALSLLELGLEEDLAIGGAGRYTSILWARLADALAQVHGSRAALATMDQAQAFALSRGLADDAATATAQQFWRLETDPRDAGIAALLGVQAELAAMGDVQTLAFNQATLAMALTDAGRAEEARVAAGPVVELARRTGDVQAWTLGVTAAAAAALASGDAEEARGLLHLLASLVERSGLANHPMYVTLLPRLARTAVAAAVPEVAARLVGPVRPNLPLRVHVLAGCEALLAESHAELAAAAEGFAGAAVGWEGFGNDFERAHALLGAGRCGLALGSERAGDDVRAARDLFAALGVQPALAECDRLLA